MLPFLKNFLINILKHLSKIPQAFCSAFVHAEATQLVNGICYKKKSEAMYYLQS